MGYSWDVHELSGGHSLVCLSLQGFEKRELAELLPAPKVSPEQVGVREWLPKTCHVDPCFERLELCLAW